MAICKTVYSSCLTLAVVMIGFNDERMFAFSFEMSLSFTSIDILDIEERDESHLLLAELSFKNVLGQFYQ